MKTRNSAFTLVELIVVITIIAILGSVGFISYTSYLAGARDTNRIVQMDAIHKALTLFTLRSRLPIPESAVEIYDGDQLLGYQGYISATQLETISYSQGGKDPKTAKYFTYTIDARKKHSQLLAYLEEPVPSSLQAYGISTSFADDYDNLYPYSIGDALGVILTETTQEPLQEVVSGNIDLSSATDGEYVAHFTGAEESSGSGDQIVGAIEENRGGSGGGSASTGGSSTSTYHASCQEILDAGESTGDGVYTIRLGNVDMSVYCDMTTDNGGWTLVLGTGTAFDKDSDFWNGTLGSNVNYFYGDYTGNSGDAEKILRNFDFTQLMYVIIGPTNTEGKRSQKPVIFTSDTNDTFVDKKNTGSTFVSNDPSSCGNMAWNVADRDGYTHGDFLLACSTGHRAYGDTYRYGIGISGGASPSGSYYGTRFYQRKNPNSAANEENCPDTDINAPEICSFQRCNNSQFCNSGHNVHKTFSLAYSYHRGISETLTSDADFGIFFR